MTTTHYVFVSSKMLELKSERDMLFKLIPTLGTPLYELRPWIFEEDAPASDHPVRSVYLDGLKACDLYIGLFWNEYGKWTIDEYQRAKDWGIPRHIYVKDVEPNRREQALKDFLNNEQGISYGMGAFQLIAEVE